MLVAALALGAFGVAGALASSPSPPINDNYIDSLEINAPGEPLKDTVTFSSVVDTTSATVQSNIFDPCGPACKPPPGPAERTRCDGVSYGKTVWYDFYPNANGVVRIRTSGFRNVIALYTFSINPHASAYSKQRSAGLRRDAGDVGIGPRRARLARAAAAWV